jgi:hypothetical protein
VALLSCGLRPRPNIYLPFAETHLLLNAPRFPYAILCEFGPPRRRAQFASPRPFSKNFVTLSRIRAIPSPMITSRTVPALSPRPSPIKTPEHCPRCTSKKITTKAAARRNSKPLASISLHRCRTCNHRFSPRPRAPCATRHIRSLKSSTGSRITIAASPWKRLPAASPPVTAATSLRQQFHAGCWRTPALPPIGVCAPRGADFALGRWSSVSPSSFTRCGRGRAPHRHAPSRAGLGGDSNPALR